MELLVVTALMGTVLAVVFSFFPLGSNYWERSAALAEAHQHARIAVEEVVHELHYAHRVRVDQQNWLITYWKDVEGELKRYKIYQWGRQILLDLPEGTAVPLAGCIDRMWVEPDGVLQRGQLLVLTVHTSWEGHGVKLRSAVVPRNLQVAGL